jgi:hypothetical protein
MSKMVVDSRCPETTTTGATAADTAAITCARRPPPNSAASRPHMSTTAPRARTEGKRSSISCSVSGQPSAIRPVRPAHNGTSGGWSS